MRGNLSQRLKTLQLEKNESESSSDGPTQRPSSRSSPKISPNQSLLEGSAFSPYNLSATGPGGLTSMLKSLRRLRDNRVKGLNGGHGGQISGDLTNEAYPSSSNKEHSFDCNNNTRTNQESDTTDFDDELAKRIIRQVEYYFGDYNLPKDKWMLEKLEQNEDGWFDMEMMMSFPRLRSLTQDPNIVLTSLAKSSNDVLQVENWGAGKGRIRRNPNKPLPELNEARKLSEQERTIFVWGFDKTTTSLDDLIEYFEENFENVANIRQRTIPGSDDLKEREFIGSVFVTFKTRQDAEAFSAKRGAIKFKDGRNLRIKWKEEYLKDRKNFNDEFNEATIERTILVDGFNTKTTTKEELVRFFKMFKGTTAIRKRVFRFGYESDAEWHFTGAVFVTFDMKENAERFMTNAEVQKLLYNEDHLSVKWGTKFYDEKGRFRRELANLKASKAME